MAQNKKGNTESIVRALIEPVAEQLGLRLWDVRFVKEGTEHYLRITIDKDEGILIEDCERMSRAIDPIIDEADPIEASYMFEVSSAGADRVLKTDAHFEQFMGAEVEVKLYRPRDGRKEFVGLLRTHNDGDVTVEINGEIAEFTKKEIALVRLYPRF